MTTEEVVKNLLDQCYALKRKHEGMFSIRGRSFTRANLEFVIAWLEEGCPFQIPAYMREERELLSLLAE